MSMIPPDIASSAAQAGFAANEASRGRDADRAGQASTSEKQVKAIDEASESVETNDEDVAVFTDAQGGGSKGRESEEQPEEQPEDTVDLPDEEEGANLDIQA